MGEKKLSKIVRELIHKPSSKWTEKSILEEIDKLESNNNKQQKLIKLYEISLAVCKENDNRNWRRALEAEKELEILKRGNESLRLQANRSDAECQLELSKRLEAEVELDKINKQCDACIQKNKDDHNRLTNIEKLFKQWEIEAYKCHPFKNEYDMGWCYGVKKCTDDLKKEMG